MKKEAKQREPIYEVTLSKFQQNQMNTLSKRLGISYKECCKKFMLFYVWCKENNLSTDVVIFLKGLDYLYLFIEVNYKIPEFLTLEEVIDTFPFIDVFESDNRPYIFIPEQGKIAIIIT